MGVYIRGMEMPQTGLYFVGVDNSNGRDKTVITVERMLGNRDVRQIVGSFELVPVPAHGRLIDADAVLRRYDYELSRTYTDDFAKGFQLGVKAAAGNGTAVVIEAEEGE